MISRAVQALLLLLALMPEAFAERLLYRVELKNHLFYPAEIVVPANVKFKLLIHNADDGYEQFDSFDLNREKVIFSDKTVTIYLGPLAPGRYQFFGEYHADSAQGVLLVKPRSALLAKEQANAH